MDAIPEHGSHVPGGTHRQASIEDELAADDLDLTPDRDEIGLAGVTLNDELLERSELAIYLLPSAFPASGVTLVETAREQGAPPDILERLELLPPATYRTVQEVWIALGGPTERRDATPAAAEADRPGARRAEPERGSAGPGWVDGVAYAAGRLTETTVRVVLGAGAFLVTRTVRRLGRRKARVPA